MARAASSPRGRSSACRAACSSPTSPSWPRATCRATSSSPGAGAFRSCSAPSWWRWACGSGCILETPTFAKLAAENKVERQPLLEVLKRHPKDIILSAFARLAEQAPFYIFTAFIFAYGTGTLKVSRDFLLIAVLAASIVSFVSIPLFGHLSDQIGRKKMYMIGAAVCGAFGFLYFGMLDTGSLTLIFLAIVLSLIPHDMMYGPQAALIAESFPGRLRYSGASLGYQFASVIAGGPAPLIATWLFARYHSGYAVAAYILACAVVTLIATAMMRDYTGKDLDAEHG